MSIEASAASNGMITHNGGGGGGGRGGGVGGELGGGAQLLAFPSVQEQLQPISLL
jgi:hypothetical protein